jgi:hypothetical protein
MSETVEVTSVSRGADAIPCTTLIAARDTKDYSMSAVEMRTEQMRHTVVKYPHTLEARRITAEMTKNGRLPHTFAPAAVKKVVKPVQKAKKPMTRLDTMSILTPYFCATRGRPGVTIGPRLMKS